MEDLQERLESFGFRRFVTKHLDYLLTHTSRHERMGKELVALGVIDELERKQCMERKGNKDRNRHFYNLLITRDASWELLVSLHFSNNNDVLRYIGRQLEFPFEPPEDENSPVTPTGKCDLSLGQEENVMFKNWNAIMEESQGLPLESKRV